MILVCACACSNKENDNSEPLIPSTAVEVTVTPSSVEIDSEAQTVEISVTANVDWSVTSDSDWVTIRPAGGVKNQTTILKVSLEKNSEFDTRVASLEIKSGNKIIKSVPVSQGYIMSASASVSSLIVSGEGGEREITITANGEWSLSGDTEWLKCNPTEGNKGTTNVTLSISPNESGETRESNLLLLCGDSSFTISVSQLDDEINIPEGYNLVWHDEFDYEGTPNSDWQIENQNAGWVNHELQTYTSRQVDGKYTLEVKDGFLHINCFKGNDGKIYSGRMNAKPSTGWQYGYVEARINLPSGKGTWPAFWMMPSNVDWTNDPWPYCGEIDIMEEVGTVKNEVSSSIHTGKYNHTIGTQKTHAMMLPGAEGEFHVYACEWDENQLTTYVDGKVQLKVTKAELGSDHASWPFDRPFYPIVNLAWGGDWGGMNGVDESVLPITMLVDYVRIFQK